MAPPDRRPARIGAPAAHRPQFESPLRVLARRASSQSLMPTSGARTTVLAARFPTPDSRLPTPGSSCRVSQRALLSGCPVPARGRPPRTTVPGATRGSRFPVPGSRLPTPDSRIVVSRVPASPPVWLPGAGAGTTAADNGTRCDSRFPVPRSRFPVPGSRCPTPDSRLPVPGSRFPTVPAMRVAARRPRAAARCRARRR